MYYLFLASITQHKVCQIHPCNSSLFFALLSSIPLYGYISIHLSICLFLFIVKQPAIVQSYLNLLGDGDWGCFQVLDVINKVAINILAQFFFWTHFLVCWINSCMWSWIAGWYMFNFVRNYQAVVQSGSTILHSL